MAGHLSQRHAWAPYLTKSNAIIYILDVSSFDMLMEENASLNRIEDSFQLFKKVCHNDFLENISLIVFFNKTDLLQQKITKKKFKLIDFFSDYTGNF